MTDLLIFNVADYIVIAVIIISTLISILRGFFRELISLIVWVVGFVVALRFYTDLSVVLESYITNDTARLIISYLALFLPVIILGVLLNHLLSLMITRAKLDRLLGTVFGFARGVLLVSVILLLISTTSFVEETWWQSSVLIPYFQTIMDWLHVFLPQKITNLNGFIG